MAAAAATAAPLEAPPAASRAEQAARHAALLAAGAAAAARCAAPVVPAYALAPPPTPAAPTPLPAPAAGFSTSAGARLRAAAASAVLSVPASAATPARRLLRAPGATVGAAAATPLRVDAPATPAEALAAVRAAVEASAAALCIDVASEAARLRKPPPAGAAADALADVDPAAHPAAWTLLRRVNAAAEVAGRGVVSVQTLLVTLSSPLGSSPLYDVRDACGGAGSPGAGERAAEEGERQARSLPALAAGGGGGGGCRADERFVATASLACGGHVLFSGRGAGPNSRTARRAAAGALLEGVLQREPGLVLRRRGAARHRRPDAARRRQVAEQRVRGTPAGDAATIEALLRDACSPLAEAARARAAPSRSGGGDAAEARRQRREAGARKQAADVAAVVEAKRAAAAAAALSLAAFPAVAAHCAALTAAQREQEGASDATPGGPLGIVAVMGLLKTYAGATGLLVRERWAEAGSTGAGAATGGAGAAAGGAPHEAPPAVDGEAGGQETGQAGGAAAKPGQPWHVCEVSVVAAPAGSGAGRPASSLQLVRACHGARAKSLARPLAAAAALEQLLAAHAGVQAAARAAEAARLRLRRKATWSGRTDVRKRARQDVCQEQPSPCASERGGGGGGGVPPSAMELDHELPVPAGSLPLPPTPAQAGRVRPQLLAAGRLLPPVIEQAGGARSQLWAPGPLPQPPALAQAGGVQPQRWASTAVGLLPQLQRLEGGMLQLPTGPLPQPPALAQAGGAQPQPWAPGPLPQPPTPGGAERPWFLQGAPQGHAPRDGSSISRSPSVRTPPPAAGGRQDAAAGGRKRRGSGGRAQRSGPTRSSEPAAAANTVEAVFGRADPAFLSALQAIQAEAAAPSGAGPRSNLPC
ncbi:hypothetical protein HT031_002450 [Scenedesmus sp. PABB004]|nr:hypothetical protein HT031_002450 [Scenedesmus sp. PABB004]